MLTDQARREELARAGRPGGRGVPGRQGRSRAAGTGRRGVGAELLESVGQDEPGLHALARAGFHTLGLQTYLTAGPEGVPRLDHPTGATAPQAAGVIHTDFERGFIKAEIVSYDDLVAAGSMAAAKAAGKVRIEGKDYVMSDGDVVEFRFNV